MKQTIEIEVPEGKKAVWKDNKVVFEDIESQLPKTWEDFCKLYPVKSGEAFITSYSGISVCGQDVLNARTAKNYNILPSVTAAEQHLALMRLHQLRDCYRRGWKPDWCKEDYKYCIKQENYKYYIKQDKRLVEYYAPKVELYKTVPEFLSFPTKEIAVEFLNNFKDLIAQAGDLI